MLFKKQTKKNRNQKHKPNKQTKTKQTNKQQQQKPKKRQQQQNWTSVFTMPHGFSSVSTCLLKQESLQKNKKNKNPTTPTS